MRNYQTIKLPRRINLILKDHFYQLIKTTSHPSVLKFLASLKLRQTGRRTGLRFQVQESQPSCFHPINELHSFQLSQTAKSTNHKKQIPTRLRRVRRIPKAFGTFIHSFPFILSFQNSSSDKNNILPIRRGELHECE